jgi:hypothetical protein
MPSTPSPNEYLSFELIFYTCWFSLDNTFKGRKLQQPFLYIEFYLSEKMKTWETGILEEVTADFFELRNKVVDMFPGCLAQEKPKVS